MTFKLNDITFVLGQGGSGRQANGTDYIAGMLFYNNTRPTAFKPNGVDNFTSGSVRQIFSAADAVGLGIDDTYSDETPSTGTIQVTGVGTNGDTIEIKVAEYTGGSGKGLVSLGTYTKVSGDSTATLVATGIKNAINAGTNTHGYIATSSTDTVTITARKGLGTYLNAGTVYTKVLSAGATIATTIVQNVVAGVASKLAVYYYHVVRYFKKFPDGTLYIGIFDTAANATFTDIINIQTFAKGAIVQLGIWDDTKVFALSSLTAIQTQVVALRSSYKLLSSVIYAADIKALSTPLTTLAGASYNLATLTASNVTALIDNDGNAGGYDLFQQQQKTISSLGNAIGSLSNAAISEDIGNVVDRFNADDGVEFDTLMFGDGTQYNSVSTSLLHSLNNNRYLFLSLVPYTSGSYYSDDHTATAYTSDYAWIHDNRIIDRVIKNTLSIVTPILKSKIPLQTDGTMTPQFIAHIQQLVGEVIKPLIASGDLAGDASNFDASKWVLVPAGQKPNITGNVTIAVQLVENGIAHSVVIPIGFVSSL